MSKRAALIALALASQCAAAQPFPARPVHLVVPNPAGGTVDLY